jgi:type IV pilus assembly protein PilN
MRISLNLATRPFVELRPFFLRLRILMAVLAVAAIGIIVWTHTLQVRLDRAQAQMDRLVQRTTTLQQEKLHNEQRMHQPVNAAVLDRSHFLNAVFLSKSFSWTAVMMDLETVLPIGVEVTSIEPAVNADGDVIIRLRVSGDRDKAVLLVRNLERSKRFLSPRLNSESSQTKEGNGNNNNASFAGGAAAGTGVEFEILADYNPLPEGEAYAKPKAAKEGTDDSAAKGSSAVPSRPRVVKPGPQDGIVLPPYTPARPSAAQPSAMRPLSPPQGGGR